MVSLIDRLVHHSQIIDIEGDSYRMKEAQAQAKNRRSKKNKEWQMKAVNIPENWTGEEATLVHDFLADVMEAIWECHEDKMVETIMSEFMILWSF